MLLSTLTDAFIADASRILDCTPQVQLVSSGSWLGRLNETLDHEGVPYSALPAGPGLIREVRVERDRHEQEDWLGMMEVWPGEDPLLIQGVRALFGLRGGQQFVFAAARSQARLDAGLAELHATWRGWRRKVKPVRTIHDRALDVPRVGWDDLCLPPVLLADLRASVEGFVRARALYDRLGVPHRRGVLLYGPPGNGKSMLCRAMISTIGWPTVMFDASGSNVTEELDQAFELAAELAPAILVFEDVDSLFPGGNGLSAFLNQLDGLEPHEGILVIATTNHPDRLDPALTSRPSRFDLLFEIPDPPRAERERYLSRLFGELLDAASIGELVEPTQGMTMAFLKELFISSCTRALHRGDERPSMTDVRAALAQLTQHRGAAKREFQNGRAAGFGV